MIVPYGFGQVNNLPQVHHVIIVIQENRTPDNLFGSDAFSSSPQLPGANLAKQGKCLGSTVPLTSYTLDACFDPDHAHLQPYPSWIQMYNKGAMDGACEISISERSCTSLKYPNYTYVDNAQGQIQPYFDMAKQYGYANFFFQTNQGPSFPAHQFLFGGTSAPVYDDGDANQYWTWFAAENHKENAYGCVGTQLILEIDPSGAESPGYNGGLPCYNHNTLVDLLDQYKISWKYYPQGPTQSSAGSALWTAPNAILNICQPQSGACTGAEWETNVAAEIPPNPPVRGAMAPILSDIENCKLPAVSWVIPDGSWSDHAGYNSDFKGPAWVTAIVNAVGNDKTCEAKKGYWSDTVILVVWDDWGGWYDHVLPYRCDDGVCKGYSNDTGGQYVYGFRVPFLVVSAYAKPGYISGAMPPYGKGQTVPYIHDFGSILNFIEYAFGQHGEPLHLAGSPPNSGISPDYAYADVLAPDAFTSGNCKQSECPYGLSDFFDFAQAPITFQTIALPARLTGFNAKYFEDFGTHPGDPKPSDPDDDATDGDE